jgi:hypothetical protein
MSMFKGEYFHELNNEEKIDKDVAMARSKAWGGVLVLWKKCLDKFITVQQVDWSLPPNLW